MRWLAAGLAAALGAAPPLGATPTDTLVYNVAIPPRARHISVEARLTRAAAGALMLALPPSAGPAGTSVTGFSVTDDRGRPLSARRTPEAWVVQVTEAGPIRFRYRLEFESRVAGGSTGAGLDSTRLYAITRSLFVAPDPTSYRKTGGAYPSIAVTVLPPPGWQVVTGWPREGGAYRPADGDELLGATIAAAADFRFHYGRAANAGWQLALRGQRYFSDSALKDVVAASLELAAAALGDVPVPMVTYTGDLGLRGRTSGSLHGTSSIGLVWEPGEVLESSRAHDVFHETIHLWFGGAMESTRWWIEGVTDYFAARLWADYRRDPAELAELVYKSLRHYQAIPHRGGLTMSQESRQGVGGDNTGLLVYRKGMLVGLLLDAEIRRSSAGRRSLDDVARRLLARAASRNSRTVREPEIRQELVAAGGAATQRLWDRFVEGRDQIIEEDVRAALRQLTGREFHPPARIAKRKELRR